jgi:LPXTG-site transpeptidase (sortase) family protein
VSRNKPKKLSIKLKALSIFLAVFLVLAAIIIFDAGFLSLENSKIDPPLRNIVHDEKFDQITEFNLTIEKLEINVPIIPDVDGKDKKIYIEALNEGVAHYKNTALPHSGSNIVIFGHSSTVLGAGKYAKIFAALNKIDIGDEIKINFNQKEYKYLVSEKKIIAADDVSVILPTEREQLTLLTCWPVGTAEKRIAVIAKPF